MTLERPGFTGRVPSVMSIGRHPSFITSSSQPITPSTIGSSSSSSSGDGRNLSSDVEYDTLLAERTGTLFWKASVREIVVYGKDGERREVELGRGVGGGGEFRFFIIHFVSFFFFTRVGHFLSLPWTALACLTKVFIRFGLLRRSDIRTRPSLFLGASAQRMSTCTLV